MIFCVEDNKTEIIFGVVNQTEDWRFVNQWLGAAIVNTDLLTPASYHQ